MLEPRGGREWEVGTIKKRRRKELGHARRKSVAHRRQTMEMDENGENVENVEKGAIVRCNV